MTMMKRSLLLFLAGLFLCSESSGDSIGCYQDGECVNSNTVGISRTDTSGECLAYCQETEACQYFTFYANDDVCLAQSDCEVFNADGCDDCISGDVRIDVPTLNSKHVWCQLVSRSAVTWHSATFKGSVKAISTPSSLWTMKMIAWITADFLYPASGGPLTA